MTTVEIMGIVLGIIGAISSIWFIYEKVYPNRKLSWKSVQRSAKRISQKLTASNFNPTLLVGIGRGGAITASLISGCLGHRPLLVIDRKYLWMDGRRIDDMMIHMHLPVGLIEKVLIIAGEAHTGNTMRLYYDYFKKIGANIVQRAAFFVQNGCTEPIEFIGIKREKDIRMPWMFTRNYRRDSRSQQEASSLNLSTALTQNESSFTLFLIRHGQSADNEGGDRYSGITESLLTEKGIAQAQDVGRVLQKEGIQRIFTSPMKRAIATARNIQSLSGGYLTIDSRLREIDYGEWEGLTRKEVYTKWRELYEQYKVDPVYNIPPGGESPKIILERIIDFLQDIQNSLVSRITARVAIITHSAVARILLGHIKNIPLEKYRECRVDNASISKIIISHDGKINIEFENSTSHLETSI
jgi:broad specificity phosphatase PhoE/hypoxanthine phosphoribosyltransferase